MTLSDMKELVRRCGYTPSEGSWEDGTHICAFSRETHGPATYNSPQLCISYNKETGRLEGVPERYRETVGVDKAG